MPTEPQTTVRLRIAVLGPVAVSRAGPDPGSDSDPEAGGAGDAGDPTPPGVRLRGLLARLALDAGRTVGVSALVDDLWGEQPPESAANAVQSLVSRLRRALGAGLVVTASGGYRLDVGPDAVDALRFARLRRDADAEPDPARAAALLRGALELWRGPALADVRELPFAGPAADRLAEARASATEELAARGRAAGEPGTGVDALTALLAEQPLRESAAVALALALAACGRQADALAVLDRTRDALADELGVDPGPELAGTRTAVLRGVPAPVRRAPAPEPRRPAPALTSFVGRDGDVARLRDLLGRFRLVTVTGPGGAGKTRVASEAVAGNGTVAVAELAPLGDAGQVVATLLHAVGAPELVLGGDTGPGPEQRLRSALAGRDLTLVLDNCEHLVDAVAPLVADLLGAAAGLRVLATSREPLNIPGEVLHPLGALAEADAVRLFADRAAAVRPGFDARGEHAASVTEICRRLDGQPLPIELAAARTRTLSPAEIAARLNDRFRLLTSGARTAVPRHQTLRAVVDWSWDLLGPGERRLAARLGVFAGPVDAAAVEAVCGDGTVGDVFEALASLADRSLVTVVPDPDGGPTRYAMLETIREYAAARLDESGERMALEAAHADWALAVVEAAEPGLRTRDQLVHLAAIRRVEGEVSRALGRTVRGGDAGRAHRLLAGMSWSWAIRGELRPAMHRAGEVWALPVPDVPAASGAGRAIAVNRVIGALLGVVHGETGAAGENLAALAGMLPGMPQPWHPVVTMAEPVRRAFADGDESGLTALLDTAPDPWLRGVTAQVLATLAENRGDLDGERAMLRLAHELLLSTGERFGLGMTLFSLGELEDLAGENAAARALFAEAVDLARELGNLEDLPQYLVRLAALAVRGGDPAAADRYVREALDVPGARERAGIAAVDLSLADVERRRGDVALARELLARAEPEVLADTGPGFPQQRAYLLVNRAAVELDDGRPDAAAALLERATGPALESGDGPVLAMVAETSARWAVAGGRFERAGELLGVAVARRGTLHHGDPEVVAVHDAVAAALGPDGAAEAMRRGAALPPDRPPGPGA